MKAHMTHHQCGASLIEIIVTLGLMSFVVAAMGKWYWDVEKSHAKMLSMANAQQNNLSVSNIVQKEFVLTSVTSNAADAIAIDHKTVKFETVHSTGTTTFDMTAEYKNVCATIDAEFQGRWDGLDKGKLGKGLDCISDGNCLPKTMAILVIKTDENDNVTKSCLPRQFKFENGGCKYSPDDRFAPVGMGFCIYAEEGLFKKAHVDFVTYYIEDDELSYDKQRVNLNKKAAGETDVQYFEGDDTLFEED